MKTIVFLLAVLACVALGAHIPQENERHANKKHAVRAHHARHSKRDGGETDQPSPPPTPGTTEVLFESTDTTIDPNYPQPPYCVCPQSSDDIEKRHGKRHHAKKHAKRHLSRRDEGDDQTPDGPVGPPKSVPTEGPGPVVQPTGCGWTCPPCPDTSTDLQQPTPPQQEGAKRHGKKHELQRHSVHKKHAHHEENRSH